MIKFRTFIGEVKDVISETHNACTLRFDKPAELDFKPGQFFTMQFIGQDGQPEKKLRSFSVSSSPLDIFIDITVKAEGEFSTRMLNAEIGTKFKFSGPFGNFIFQEGLALKQVFISGGSGVTPYRSFVRYAMQKNLPHQFILFYSSRIPDDIIFRKELEEYAAEFNNIRNIFTITKPGGLDWDGLTGRIDRKMIQDNIDNATDAIFYICGSKELVASMIDMLKGMDVKPDHIKTERWN